MHYGMTVLMIGLLMAAAAAPPLPPYMPVMPQNQHVPPPLPYRSGPPPEPSTEPAIADLMIPPKPATDLALVLDRVVFQAQKTFNAWPIIYLVIVVGLVFACWYFAGQLLCPRSAAQPPRRR